MIYRTELETIHEGPDSIGGVYLHCYTGTRQGDRISLWCANAFEAVELQTLINIGIKTRNQTCPECGSDAPKQKCTAQCGKERF